MNRSIIRKIAKKHGVSVEEVRRDMQAAINAAYVNPGAAALSVPKKGDVPTPEEFINYCTRVVKPRS